VPVVAGMASNAGLVSPCTLGRAHAAQMAVENPKREDDGQTARAEHVEACYAEVGSVSRIDEGENGGVEQVEVEVEQGDTLKKARGRNIGAGPGPSGECCCACGCGGYSR
jgi:hypothetical protein